MLDTSSSSDVLAAPRRLHRDAVAEASLLHPVAARRLLRKALLLVDAAHVGDDIAGVTLRMQILITLAKVESELHGLEPGTALLDEAAELLYWGPSPEVIVALHNQRGVLMLRFGQWRAAIEAFDEAEQFFAAAVPLERANVLLNRGTAELMLGDLDRARRDLERCSVVAEDAELALLRSMSLHNLGYVEFLRGDLPVALRHMDDAVEFLGVPANSVGLLDRARVLAEAGLTREADETLARAVEILQRDRSTQELAETELERARCALMVGDMASARRLAARARDRFRRRGNDTWRRSAELVLLEGDLAAGRPGRRLIEPALRVRAEFVTEGQPLSARAAGLIAAEAAIAADDLGAARTIFAELGAGGRYEPITSRLHTKYVAARIATSGGQVGAARRQVRAGLAELAAYQASFGSVDVQTAAAVHGRRLAALGIRQALDDASPRAVFDAVEQARAVSTRLPTVRPPTDGAIAESMAELRQTVEALRGVEHDRVAAAPLQRRRRELERDIAARRWSLSGEGDARPLASLEAVSAALADAHTTMVTYIDVGEILHAVVIERGTARTVELGASGPVMEHIRRARADLDVLAQPLLTASMAIAVRTSLRRSCAIVSDELVAPLGLRGDRLVVVTTGLLGQVPWGLVPALIGVPVVSVSTATAWLAAHTATAGRRRGVAAVAGPDLARAGAEVAGIGSVWPGSTALLGADATRSRLTQALTTAEVVHVATHGVHQTENPMFSSLRLVDGAMFAHELDESARTPDHVILSACELGLATVRPGDEALGLTSVLLRLGTRCVIAGVARVNDDVAAETMIDYHRRLAVGRDSAEALAEASTANGAIAPFVCFGGTWQPSAARFGTTARRRVP